MNGTLGYIGYVVLLVVLLVILFRNVMPKTTEAMRLWHDFLDSLDTNGGQIVLLIFLMFVGSAAYRNGFPKAEDIAMQAFSALLMALKQSGSNKERRDTTAAIKVTETIQEKAEVPKV